MLVFSDLSLRRGGRLLFEGVTFTLHQGQKIGLVGANGSGKTSLFRLICGELEPDQGTLSIPAGIRIAHLDQEVPGSQERALDYVMSGDAELTRIREAIRLSEAEGRFDEIAGLHERLDTIDGYSAKARAEQLMAGLGFQEPEFGKALSDFSGGWRIRLNLARTLMKRSDLLLLDEPTNHLDLDAILWLSDWIHQYTGSLILVSHDREFLDECVDRIASLHHGTIDLYTGNYSQFEALRAARLAEQQGNYEKQQREIRHMQEFVRRFRYKATKARQAQSRLKALERMDRIAAAHVDSPFHFEIPPAKKSSDPLLTLEMADLGYDHAVLKNVRFSLHPGDRIGLLGNNGAGKTTLVKSLSGELALLAGERIAGANLKTGYFSQHQIDDLDLGRSAFDHLQALDRRCPEQEIRRYLGSFDFHGDKVLEKIETFSGGEKARLALALIAFTRPNLLLMDEPTNHLDMDMRQALTMALQHFSGALLLISHDRHLLSSTVDQFLLLENGQITPWDGDLSDYRERVLGGPRTSRSSDPGSPEKKPRRETDHKTARQLRTRISTLEKRLERAQRKLREVETRLSAPGAWAGKDHPELHGWIREQSELKEQIEALENTWLDLHARLEAISRH